MLALTAALCVLAVWGGRRLRGSEKERPVLRTAGWLLLVLSVGWTLWPMLPANWDIEQSLPLHFSDVLRIIAAVALIRESRWAVAITYYWGLTLNPQAMLTPHPTQLDALSANFAFYWGLHIAVLLAAVVLIWGLGHRPQWRDFCIAYGAALLWAGISMSFNAVLGTNYGFLNRHPDGASLLDVLGPWPLYVLWLVVLAGGIWALMTWPWTIRRKNGRSPADQTGSSENRGD